MSKKSRTGIRPLGAIGHTTPMVVDAAFVHIRSNNTVTVSHHFWIKINLTVTLVRFVAIPRAAIICFY